MTRKSAYKIIEEAYNELLELKPTPEEIQEYADLKENEYGVVTYSKSKGGNHYFMRFHNTWQVKFGGRVHIDIGYVDEKYIDKDTDTTHLMLDKNHAPDFVDFIKKKRSKYERNCN